MATHRTCSYTGSLIAVSWRQSCAAAPDVLVDVEVVADDFLNGSRLVALITLRLFDSDAHAEVSVDGQTLASYDLCRSLPEPTGVPGCLFRRLVPLPPDLADGHTHVLTLVVDQPRQGRASIATHETAFYARRASNRRLVLGTQPDAEQVARTPRPN